MNLWCWGHSVVELSHRLFSSTAELARGEKGLFRRALT